MRTSAQFWLNALRVVILAASLGPAGAINAQIFTDTHAQYDFNSGSPIGWTPARLTGSFFGGGALGPFGNETASLGLMDVLRPDSVPEVDRTVQLSFDLQLGGDWFGDTPGLESFFQVTGNGNPLLLTTFSVFDGSTQSFPYAFGAGSSPAGSGAFYFNPDFASATTIRLSFPIYYSAIFSTDLRINFAASNLDAGAYWQLDNVSVDWATPLPEPNSLALVVWGIALVGLGKWYIRQTLKAANKACG